MATEVRIGQKWHRDVFTRKGLGGTSGALMVFSIFDLGADDLDMFICKKKKKIHHDI